MQIEQMSVPAGSELGRHAGQGAAGLHADHPLHVGILAEERDIRSLREHSDTRAWMTVPDGAEEGGGQEHVADGAEAYRQGVWGGGSVVHAEKVQRER
jgi:hypothetical protein